MSNFKVGSIVRSLVEDQGLRHGATYEVVEVVRKSVPWGEYVTYKVMPWDAVGGEALSITNGHMVLESIA